MTRSSARSSSHDMSRGTTASPVIGIRCGTGLQFLALFVLPVAPKHPLLPSLAELRYGSTLMRLDFVWLRDHCRSASCYNAKTNQRSLDTASVDLAIRPQAVRVDETTLFLTCES